MHKLVSRSKSLREVRGAHRTGAAKAPGVLHGKLDETIHTTSGSGHVIRNDASNNVHQYACPPIPEGLPSQPRRAHRPSSSSGPSRSKTTKDHLLHVRKVSRDDFYLSSSTSSGATGFGGQSLSSYDTSTNTIPVQLFASSNNSQSTADSRKDAHGNRGSREHAIPIATSSRDNSGDSFDAPLGRKPTGRWKLRGIFGRRQPSQPDAAPIIPDSNDFDGIYTEKTVVVTCEAFSPDTRYPSRSNTISSRKPRMQKPSAGRSQTLPPLGHQGDQKPGGSWSREDGKPAHSLAVVDAASESRSATGLWLDVEIPDVQLERYSVMFDSVLNPNPLSSSSSSLLSTSSTCKAIVQEPQSIEDLIRKEENTNSHEVIRRETSSQPAEIYSLGSVLSATSNQDEYLLSRKSPLRSRFSTSPTHIQPRSQSISDHPTSILSSPKNSPGRDTSNSTHFKHHAYPHIEKSVFAVSPKSHTTEQVPATTLRQSIIDPPNEETMSDEVVFTRPAWKPVAYHLPLEAKRQISSATPDTRPLPSPYVDNHSKPSFSPATPSSPIHVRKIAEEESSDDGDDVSDESITDNRDIKITPTEVSIARQVSISRQNRKLIRPVITTARGTPGRRPSQAQTTPTTATAADASLLTGTKASPPALAHLPEVPDTKSSLVQHQRSERIVV